MRISKPKMILFDQGRTLVYEPGFNPVRGNAKLLEYAVRNPNNYTLEDVRKAADLIFGTHIEAVRKSGYEICGQVGDKVLYDYLGIEFDLTPVEMENIFWTAASPGAVMPGADKVLNYLQEKGIRTGVISNLMWSGSALTERLNRLLPNNSFEFILTSSDYMFRKPNRILFDIALQKAGLKSKDVWYCGDSVTADVEGAAQSGIFPVWYDNTTVADKGSKPKGTPPTVEHLHINEWTELIEILEKLQEE